MILNRIKQLSKRNQRGFTLIELLLYISLVTIFLSGAIRFSWDVIYSREKAYSQRIVSQSANTAMMRVAYEIRQAKNITSVTSSQIVLDNNGSSTTISLNGTTLEISPNGAGPYTLTSNQVRVTSLTFTNTSNANINSKGVGIEMTIEQASTGISENFIASSSIKQSVELNSFFNHSRSLLVDLTNISVANPNRIDGITFQNMGTGDLIIDQMYLNWTDLLGTENLTSVQLEAGTKEWTGTAGPDSTIDLTNFTIAPADGIIDLTYLQFDSSMIGGTLFLDIILADGSTHKSEVALPGTVAPSPTPTPTPTPSPTITPTPTPTPPAVDSCTSYCASLPAYGAGTCRKNPAACNKAGEVHEAGGDSWCTGGANADTCCCL